MYASGKSMSPVEVLKAWVPSWLRTSSQGDKTPRTPNGNPAQKESAFDGTIKGGDIKTKTSEVKYGHSISGESWSDPPDELPVPVTPANKDVEEPEAKRYLPTFFIRCAVRSHKS